MAYDGARRTVVPITFDPDAPPAPPPVVEVTPATALEDGQPVAVAATGFSPGADVAVLQCSALTPDDLDLEHCDLSGAVVVETDDAGGVSTDYVVRSAIATISDGVVSCESAEAACTLAVISLYDDLERGGVAQAFGGGVSDSTSGSQALMAAAGQTHRRWAGAARIPDRYLGSGGRALRGSSEGTRDPIP